eukprot:scaffold19975_cov48-Phaeocystis_antarctica.AAC.2
MRSLETVVMMDTSSSATPSALDAAATVPRREVSAMFTAVGVVEAGTAMVAVMRTLAAATRITTSHLSTPAVVATFACKLDLSLPENSSTLPLAISVITTVPVEGGGGGEGGGGDGDGGGEESGGRLGGGGLGGGQLGGSKLGDGGGLVDGDGLGGGFGGLGLGGGSSAVLMRRLAVLAASSAAAAAETEAAAKGLTAGKPGPGEAASTAAGCNQLRSGLAAAAADATAMAAATRTAAARTAAARTAAARTAPVARAAAKARAEMEAAAA